MKYITGLALLSSASAFQAFGAKKKAVKPAGPVSLDDIVFICYFDS